MKNLTDENHAKTLIIKTLTGNLNTISKEKFITNNQNLNKNQCQDSTNNNSFKYPKRFASLPRKSNLTNAAEGISVSPNPFQLLEHNNIQYTILDENDSNAYNTMMNPIINRNDNIQVVKRRPAIVINNHPENQNQLRNIATVPGEKTYSETVRGRYKPSTLIFSKNSVTLLGLEIDSKLNFDKHISKLCNKCAGILNALYRIKRLSAFNERKILVNSFIYGNFNYCPLVWHFCTKESTYKIENIQKRTLRFLLNDYDSDCKTLLEKSKKCSMEIRRIRTLALETFKSLNKLNPHFMKDLFNKRNTFERRKNNLEIPRRNTIKFGDNSVKSFGPHIWNSLPEEIKSEQSYEKFKGFIETWYGPNCKCCLCVYLQETKYLH